MYSIRISRLSSPSDRITAVGSCHATEVGCGFEVQIFLNDQLVHGQRHEARFLAELKPRSSVRRTSTSATRYSMSLRKQCNASYPIDHPRHCLKSPVCEHYWFYDFRINRRRYRNTTETANKQDAKKFEANERSRILAGRRGIPQQPDISFRSFAEDYIRDHAELHKRSVTRDREILKCSIGPLGHSSSMRSPRIGLSSSNESGWRGSGAAIGTRPRPNP